MFSSSGIVLEHLAHNPKNEGLNPAGERVSSNCRVNMAKQLYVTGGGSSMTEYWTHYPKIRVQIQLWHLQRVTCTRIEKKEKILDADGGEHCARTRSSQPWKWGFESCHLNWERPLRLEERKWQEENLWSASGGTVAQLLTHYLKIRVQIQLLPPLGEPLVPG